MIVSLFPQTDADALTSAQTIKLEAISLPFAAMTDFDKPAQPSAPVDPKTTTLGAGALTFSFATLLVGASLY